MPDPFACGGVDGVGHGGGNGGDAHFSYTRGAPVAWDDVDFDQGHLIHA